LSELQRERRLSSREPSRLPVQPSAARTTEPDADAAAPAARSGPAAAAERQLLEILLADPGLVPRAAAAMAPDEVAHTGLRRLLAELYRSQAAGAVPDLDWLREQLMDRPDLFEAAQRLQFVGQQMQEREQWLGRLLVRFTEMKTAAEARSLKEKLAASNGEAAVDLLRQLQETDEWRKSAG
jgi:DNA primase